MARGAAGSRFPFVGGIEHDLSLPPALITTADIPAVAALPDPARNRRLRLGPVTEDGVLVGYGDYGTNPGPLDLLAVDQAGTVTTLLSALPTEETTGFCVLGGDVWLPSIDPHGAAPGFLATNAGGPWRMIEVAIDGLAAVEHMFGVALDGALLVCGSHWPDTAFVWESTDGGASWTETLAYASGESDGLNRFYGFRRDPSGQLVVDRSDGAGSFVRIDGAWTATAIAPTGPLPRDVWVRSDGMLAHHQRGSLGTLPGSAADWTASLDPNGSIWLSDGTSIYRLPPPE